MGNKRKTLKTLADFFSNIQKWMKDKAKPLDPIEPLKPEPLKPTPVDPTPVKPRPDIEPPRPVEEEK